MKQYIRFKKAMKRADYLINIYEMPFDEKQNTYTRPRNYQKGKIMSKKNKNEIKRELENKNRFNWDENTINILTDYIIDFPDKLIQLLEENNINIESIDYALDNLIDKEQTIYNLKKKLKQKMQIIQRICTRLKYCMKKKAIMSI